MTQLTEHFSLDEFTASNTADAHGWDNSPTPVHLEHLRDLAEFMEKVRALFNRAVVMSSVYRNPRVNKAVGGVPTSDHAQGYAGDFHVAGWSDYAVAQKIAASDLEFDQLIYEKGRCVHVSIAPRMRRQVLSQPGGPGSPVHQGINE